MGLLVSLGDLSVIALFGSERLMTLPYLLYQRLGSYRTGDAAGLGLILLAITFAVSAILQRLGDRRRP
jgi:thiamine transport system permease protein